MVSKFWLLIQKQTKSVIYLFYGICYIYIKMFGFVKFIEFLDKEDWVKPTCKSHSSKPIEISILIKIRSLLGATEQEIGTVQRISLLSKDF